MSEKLTQEALKELQDKVYEMFFTIVVYLSDDEVAALLGLVSAQPWVSRHNAIARIAYDVYYCELRRGVVLKIMQNIFETHLLQRKISENK